MSRAAAHFDRADTLEQCGEPEAACRAYQAALHLDPHCRAAAVNLGVLLKCVDRLPACRAALRHAAALHAQLRLNEPQRLCDGGPTFGMGACAPSQLAQAAAVLRQALHAGGHGSRATLCLPYISHISLHLPTSPYAERRRLWKPRCAAAAAAARRGERGRRRRR